jgi:hypothetical protein
MARTSASWSEPLASGAWRAGSATPKLDSSKTGQGAPEGRLRPREVHIVSCLLTMSTNALLGLPARLLSPRFINLFCCLCLVRKNRHSILADLDKPPCHGKLFLSLPPPEDDLSMGQCRHEGRVAGKNGKLTL